ncbi:hypothetical protein SEA_EVANESCE_39 [Mycobacterium phage Evanesce]|uniref:Uncharacterized protein n=14 Tax=Caudoviricetes TaxID=2731619 RepID=A0A385D108_9CAUD|nr:hypothetical protein Giles_39 [Mycobacterium phage Giles]AKQ07816.1 hypothetical protein SEA_KINBOTE_40 [Mycobacterium phage Kinbote]ALA06684.1 hypothetical protein SEA_OBUpride_40 [Mycobacterium phage OBUpride]ALF00260.1 hypothetical protein SEA_EVANESCE_39 [Mycobacterium phage Evanesce]ATN90391.1 hypothetical protein SEA_LILHAZELNUT_40 [Mycobacterium phage LilHazelnut]AXQ51471.1 hypothetical protein SEA_AMOCHICK_40 [Mycobacterium phage Amochick]AYB69381.1 hypothetical protein SEA_GANCHO_
MRGAHRSGPWSVAALTAAVEAQRDRDRRAHLASLRRPPKAMIYLGDVMTPVRLYGIVPDPVHLELWMPGDRLRA